MKDVAKTRTASIRNTLYLRLLAEFGGFSRSIRCLAEYYFRTMDTKEMNRVKDFDVKKGIHD